MASCPQVESCPFFGAVQPSLVKRLKYASAYPFCKGGIHESCVLYPTVSRGLHPPADTLPDGTRDHYIEHKSSTAVADSGRPTYVVVEDSPVFATIATNTVRAFIGPNADVVQCLSYEEAEPHLLSSDVRLVVCGYGIGNGRTAHDLRRLSDAPMVLMTGRVGQIHEPAHSVVVEKNAGPDRLKAAIAEIMGNQTPQVA